MEFLTTKEVSEMYNITDAGVRVAIKRGILTEGVNCIKVGKTWFIKPEKAEDIWGHRV